MYNDCVNQWNLLHLLPSRFFGSPQINKILKKKYHKMIQQPVQKTDILCGSYTIFAAFELIKIFQTKLTNVHDVHVLIFISNYM